MAGSAQLAAAMLLLAAVAHQSTADVSQIRSRSESLRENQALKYLSRSPSVRTLEAINAAINGKSRRPPSYTSTDTDIRGSPCKESFKYVYVPVASTMTFTSPSRGGNYSTDIVCGWWFWTEDNYMFEASCKRISLVDGDYLVFINEDDGTELEFTNMDVKNVDSSMIDFGVSNDLTAGFTSDAAGVDKGFKCQVDTIPRPLNAGCECGVPNTDGARRADTRLVDGALSVVGDHPWAVAIKKTETETDYLCGGIIIGAEWILTAAVCMAFEDNLWLDVGSGSTVYAEPTIGKVVHPNFVVTSTEAQYNVGLLKVSQLSFSSTVAPICLPEGSETFEEVAVNFAGYGTLDPANPSDSSPVLYEGDYMTVTNADCATDLATNTPLVPSSNDICAIDLVDDSFPCHRDWGSGLVYDTGPYKVLVGVLSAAVRCQTYSTGVVHPDMYTRVTHMLDFINSEVSAENFCPMPE